MQKAGGAAHAPVSKPSLLEVARVSIPRRPPRAVLNTSICRKTTAATAAVPKKLPGLKVS
jgi:hypothetical protein